MKGLKYENADIIIVCPYCMEYVQIEPTTLCCGEVHAQEAYLFEDDTVELID